MSAVEQSQFRENVTLLRVDSREIYLVGTAHVSRSSAELVSSIIQEVSPDRIGIELCAARYDSLQDPDRWRKTDIFEVIKSGRAYVLLTQLVLAAFQRRLADQFGIRPGEEMLTAMTLAAEKSIPLSLIDRDVKITLRRAWSHAGLLGVAKIMASFITSFFSKDQVTERELEELKKGDALAALMSEFSDLLPGVKGALIDERDIYMAAKINGTPGARIVVIVGAGHVPGICRWISEPSLDTNRLEVIPPPTIAQKIIKWSIPALLAALLLGAFLGSGKAAGLEMLGTWALANGLGALLGAIISAAHPLTLVLAFFSAPFAALHPVIAVGWLCALLECWLRKPEVQDFELLSEDLSTIKGWWKNRISHIFLVLILANLGSVIGTVVGITLGSLGISLL